MELVGVSPGHSCRHTTVRSTTRSSSFPFSHTTIVNTSVSENNNNNPDLSIRVQTRSTSRSRMGANQSRGTVMVEETTSVQPTVVVESCHHHHHHHHRRRRHCHRCCRTRHCHHCCNCEGCRVNNQLPQFPPPPMVPAPPPQPPIIMPLSSMIPLPPPPPPPPQATSTPPAFRHFVPDAPPNSDEQFGMPRITDNENGTCITISRLPTTIVVPGSAAITHTAYRHPPVPRRIEAAPVNQPEGVLAWRFPDGRIRYMQDENGGYVRRSFAGVVWCPETGTCHAVHCD